MKKSSKILIHYCSGWSYRRTTIPINHIQ